MKAKTLLPLLFLAHFGRAAIVVPGANGTDGALNVTANTEIDLSQAVTGVWDQDNTANLGKGVYDPAKWAVVFKYTDVNIAAGATVTFKNHPSRAPVVWLVSGNVTIDGVVSLDGGDSSTSGQVIEPGPGGFRGGVAYFSPNVLGGAGFGVGGGSQGGWGGGGSYGTAGNNGSTVYGNPSLIPLIGGSGGGNAPSYSDSSGGGGGGAMLIASEGFVTINGIVQANGGHGRLAPAHGGAGGSGGGIRIVSENMGGIGFVQCLGGASNGSIGGLGRIRIERVSNTSSASINPAPSIVDLAPGSTAILWPPSGSPEVRVISIGGEAAPADPRAAFGTIGADVALPVTSSATVLVETKNVEPESVVQVRITPRDTYNAQVITATRVDPPVSTSPLTYHWTANVPTNLGYSAIQVKVVRP